MAERRDEETVRVLGVDVDHRDHLRFAKTQVRPRLSGVGRLVDPVAHRKVGPDDPRSGADINDVWIRRRHGDRANGARRLRVEQRHPRRAVVGRAPDSAVVESDVKDARLARHAGQRARAAGSRRADLSPRHSSGKVPGLGSGV